MSRNPRLCFATAVIFLLSISHLGAAQQEPAGPPSCNPCVLFYGGDFDASNPNANALANEFTTAVVSGATVYVPFVVPEGQTWTVTGLFTNNLSYTPVIDPQEAIWSIVSGMSQGNGGTVIANNASPATYNATGRSGFGMREHTVLTTIDPPVTLAAGEYWMSVVPECKNATDIHCAAAAYYLSDVEDSPAHQAKGDEPKDQAFYLSGEFGYFYWPTWGSNGACQDTGCDKFSAGVLGMSTEQ
jgi:hypothetical protein